MGRLVITDLFAADAFNKFAGKLVGRMSRNVQLSVSFEEMMNQSPHGFRRITVFAVSGVDEITQIAVYLLPFSSKGSMSIVTLPMSLSFGRRTAMR